MSLSRHDDDSLRACCDAALAAACSAPEDPSFPGLPDGSPLATDDRVAGGTVVFDAEGELVARVSEGDLLSLVDG